jgi:hypothetical protein
MTPDPRKERASIAYAMVPFTCQMETILSDPLPFPPPLPTLRDPLPLLYHSSPSASFQGHGVPGLGQLPPRRRDRGGDAAVPLSGRRRAAPGDGVF